MYEKIILCLLIVFVITRSEEVSTAKNVENADFVNSKLSTDFLPSIHNDEPIIKDNPKRSLILLMPLSQKQNEHEKSKEIVQKVKRCGTQYRKNKSILLSTKKDSKRARTIDKNVNVAISKQNSDNYIVKNAKYSQENSATSKRMVDNTDENKMLLQALKDNLNVEDVIVNLKSQEKAKKCNTEKYICHCKEDDSSSSSLKKNSSRMLGSSRADKPKRTNHRRLKYKNAKSNILKQKSPKLYYENYPHELPLPDLINYFSVQPYQENLNHIPPVPILYGITPNISPDIIGNEEIPFTSFEDIPNYLVGSNQYQPIVHQKPYLCSPVAGKHQIESSKSVTSPSINYDDTTTTNLESNNLIGITEDQEYSSKLTTETPNLDVSETETNLRLNYPTNVIEESNTISPSNLDKIVHKSEDSSEHIERNSDNLSDYVDMSSTPSFVYDETNNGKFISMKECIQLFGRDMCVLSATSPRKLAKLTQENNPKKYPIRIPEYVTQMSARKETTLNSMNNSDKFKTTDPASESSTNEINKSNVNLNEYLNSTSTKSNVDANETSLREFHQYPESIEQISKSNINYEDKSFSTVNSAPTIKKLIDSTIDDLAKMERNKLLGKSKSHTTKLVLNPNNEKITNQTPAETLLYSTPSHKSSKNEKVNDFKINQQTQVTNTNSNSNNSKEETTVTNYNSKTDFKEETEKEVEANTHPEEIPQEQSTTMQYFEDEKSSNLNNKEVTANNLETITDSSTSRLPFCDNTLLLNSIRKVINDFALDARLTKTNDFNENILQSQGKNLLPEILQVPHLKNILSIPRIESTIVEKVKDVLSHVTAIPRKDFTNDWSHGVIKNTLHSILDALSGFHHELPPMTLKEHQFNDGEWKTSLVTLAPVSDQKVSSATPKHLQQSIKDLLSSSAIASQVNQYIVRNMIVQSVKNSLINNEDNEIDDSIIHALNDVLQSLKDSEDTDALDKSNEVISNEENTDMVVQKMPTSNNEIGINIDNSSLKGKQNLDIKQDTKMDEKKRQTVDYQKAKILENNTNILTTSEFPHLQLHEEKEKEITNKDKIEEDIKVQIFNKIKKTDTEDAKKKAAELPNSKITYHKAILKSNPSILTTFESNSTETEENIKNHHIDESVKDTTTITNLMQEISPNYAQVSDGIILENTVGATNIGQEVKQKNEKTLTTSTDEIDPLIILERIKFNLPPTKYYSPEILKYATNRIDDKNVEITTASTNYVQENSFNYAPVSDDTILQNVSETKNNGDEMEYPLTTTFNNLIISSTNVENVENTDYKPKIISLTDKNILESQQQNFTEDNIIKIHEVTTEVQRTYAKTMYFKAGSSSDSSRISSPSLTYETTDIRVNNNDNENSSSNSDNDNNNLFGNKMNNTDPIVKAKEMIVSSSKSSAMDDTYPSQLFPSSTASDDISKLQESQLYYVSDGMRLPLEIKRLQDGSYTLSISKNICEQLLTRKCPCCVPLQGRIIQLLKNHQEEDAMTSTTMEKKDQENIYENIKRDYQSVQPFNTMVTRRSALGKLKEEEEGEEERTNAHHLWKQNDDNLAMISMSVIDFVKKYNLLLNFNEEGLLFNEAELQNKIQNYDESLMKSVKGFEHDQTEEMNLNNYPNIKKNRLLDKSNAFDNNFQDLINIREKKNIPNFPITQKIFNLRKNSKEFKVRKDAEMSQSEINQVLKLHEVQTANDVRNINIVQEINPENQKKINTVQKINISEESKIGKEELKSNKLSDIVKDNTRVLYKKENRKPKTTESIDDEFDVTGIKNFKENIGKPNRYQRNTNDLTNKRTELIKSMLHWIKGFFVDK